MAQVPIDPTTVAHFIAGLLCSGVIRSTEPTCIHLPGNRVECIYRAVYRHFFVRQRYAPASGKVVSRPRQLESLVDFRKRPPESRGDRMAAQPEPPSAAGRQRAVKPGRSLARPAKLSRDGIVEGALTFLD